jgi:6-pyruvoyl-tetrahydropterin synthase
MDILEQFLHSIAYKFPKGYPDMKNEQDILILENEFKKIGVDLEELKLTKHYIDRKFERRNILDIPNLTQQMVGDRNVQETKENIINQIEGELLKRLASLENIKTLPASFKEVIVYKILKPILLSNGERYNLLFTTESTKNDIIKPYTDGYYYALIGDDNLITLMGGKGNDSEIEDRSIEYLKKTNKSIKPIKILTLSDFEYVIPLDEPNKEKTLIDPNTLPYRLKTSYRPGTNFTHNDYGTGTVIAAASAGTRSGEPDSRGIVDWVEVDFGRPYVAGGQLKKTRTIKNVYTSISPDLDVKAAE